MQVPDTKIAEIIDRSRKMRVYACKGVAHLWLVDPLVRTVQAYRLESGRWLVVTAHGGDDAARIEPFEAVEMRLARRWPPNAAASA